MSISKNTMTRLAATAALGLAGLSGAMSSAQAATNVGVSVSVNQPGFYGRVDIGEQPPVLLYPQPVIIQQSPYGARQRPIYMRVPPGHSKNWSRYCGQYSACGQPVYFVRDAQPPRGDRYGRDDHDRHDHDRGGWREDDRGGRGDRGDRDERGHGRGKGRGHGHD
ncbi:hypothetical protein [Aquabacterium sp.]|jgi:hypothetical protein|uniref:hypothetical protein n=1 Tax=Aquabacterium sp. TaxID=1872578 RepID=UPI0024892206|nr:hypothetical protein [Aquabacterium sp.]MDI1348997.1 hypothetical protein [Aquabacterium sp.]